MTDLVVTVAARDWADWLAEGDLAGEPWSGAEHAITVRGRVDVEAGERVYIACGGFVRGYAPLIRSIYLFSRGRYRTALIRGGGAVALTPMCLYPDRCDCPVQWQGPHPLRLNTTGDAARYRDWDRGAEWALLDWKSVPFEIRKRRRTKA